MLAVNRRILIVLLLLVSATLKLVAQGTAFNYQGRLNDGGAPATGAYDFRFAVYDAVTNGSAVSVSVTNAAVGVTNGLFSVTLDFGAGVFAGTNVWLDLAVRAVTVTNFTPLFPRQPVLPVPYAIFATGASNLLGKLAVAQISGNLPASQVAGTSTNLVNFTNPNNTFGGTFTGTGSSLSNLNASQLTTGTVADARLSSNVALLNQNQTFTGTNTFTGPNLFTSSNSFTGTNQFTGANTFTNLANSFSGSFFGNGLVGWVVVPNAAVTAQIDHGYVLTSAQFTTVTMPTNPGVVDIVRISGAGAGGWRAVANTNQRFIGNFSSYDDSVWLPATTSGVSWLSLAASADGQRMYAASGAATGGGIFTSSDAGHTWNGPVGGFNGSWNGVASSADGNTAYAVVPGQAIWFTVNAGTTWSANSSTTGSNCTLIACSASGTKAVVVTKGGSVLTNNAAWNWFSTGASVSTWISVACSDSGNVCAVGNASGTVYSSVAGSQTVTTKPITGLVISTDGTRLAACALGGGISVSTNSGTSWNLTSAPTLNWNCLAASADCTRLVAGVSNGVIYASANFGGTWTQLIGSTNQVWSALASSDDGTKLAGAVNTASGGIYYSTATTASTVGTNSFITGSQGSAVELQYIGNGQFMPVSSTGSIWAN